MSSAPSVGYLLKTATDRLTAAGITNARLDARLLLAHVVVSEPLQLMAYPNEILTTTQHDHFQQLLQRRLAFEPVSRIIGRREFWGLDLAISPETLDPRADSETLIETVLNNIHDSTAPLSILDLGTGTGCLLLALLHELPQAHGVGIDISADAILTARQNADQLSLSTRTIFCQQDWQEALSGQYDWIVSNPPYIPRADIVNLAPDVRLYDPLKALDGGQDGLDCYRALSGLLKPLLKPDGKLAIEIGYGQAPAVQEIFYQQGFKHHHWACDLAGIARCGLFS